MWGLTVFRLPGRALCMRVRACAHPRRLHARGTPRERGGSSSRNAHGAAPASHRRVSCARAAPRPCRSSSARPPPPPAPGRRDETCPVSTGGGTRRVQSVRKGGGGGRGEGGTCASALSTTLYVVAVGRAPCARARPPAVHARMAPQGLLHSKGCEERNGSNGTNGSTGGTENLSSSRNLSASSAILAPPGARCTNARGRSLSGRMPLGVGHDAGPGARAASVFGSSFYFRHQTPTPDYYLRFRNIVNEQLGGRARGHRGVGEGLEQRLAGGEVQPHAGLGRPLCQVPRHLHLPARPDQGP
jgi:hypothetical protein